MNESDDFVYLVVWTVVGSSAVLHALVMSQKICTNTHSFVKKHDKIMT